jgi:hypothetical protein
VRCSVSRGVRSSEAEQLRCKANETALGEKAYDVGTQAVRDLFGGRRKVAYLDYNAAIEALADGGDETAKSARRAALAPAAPAVARAADVMVKPYAV